MDKVSSAQDNSDDFDCSGIVPPHPLIIRTVDSKKDIIIGLGMDVIFLISVSIKVKDLT